MATSSCLSSYDYDVWEVLIWLDVYLNFTWSLLVVLIHNGLSAPLLFLFGQLLVEMSMKQHFSIPHTLAGWLMGFLYLSDVFVLTISVSICKKNVFLKKHTYLRCHVINC